MPACFLLLSLRRATLLLCSHIFSFWDRNLLLWKGSKRACTIPEYGELLLCYFLIACSYEEKFFSERRSRELLGHNGDENETRLKYSRENNLFAVFFLLRSFWTNICVCRNSQINHLVFFLPPDLDKMYNSEPERGQEMVDVIVNCCHASYPFQKCGIIVSEGLWLLSWDLQYGYLALMTLTDMKDGYPHCHNGPFSVILPAGECDSASLNTFLCICTHETQWQWSRCSLYEIWPVIHKRWSSLSSLPLFLKASCSDLIDHWMHFPDMIFCFYFPSPFSFLICEMKQWGGRNEL